MSSIKEFINDQANLIGSFWSKNSPMEGFAAADAELTELIVASTADQNQLVQATAGAALAVAEIPVAASLGFFELTSDTISVGQQVLQEGIDAGLETIGGGIKNVAHGLANTVGRFGDATYWTQTSTAELAHDLVGFGEGVAMTAYGLTGLTTAIDGLPRMTMQSLATPEGIALPILVVNQEAAGAQIIVGGAIAGGPVVMMSQATSGKSGDSSSQSIRGAMKSLDSLDTHYPPVKTTANLDVLLKKYMEAKMNLPAPLRVAIKDLLNNNRAFRQYYTKAIDRFYKGNEARLKKEVLRRELKPVDHTERITEDLVKGDPKKSWAQTPYDNDELRALKNTGEIPTGYEGYNHAAKQVWSLGDAD